MFGGSCGSGTWGYLLGHSGIWGWLGLLFDVIFWLSLLIGIVPLARWAVRNSRAGAPGAPTAREILKTRYAQGEITHEQYELMKQDVA